ncbi:MAG: hypothetical protein ACRDHN_02690, partial [Thermomicrobiales bacterium]
MPYIGIYMPRFFICLFAVAAYLPATASADAVKLKNGEVVEGKIVRSDMVGVEIEVKFSATITDVRTIPRAEIAAAAVLGPDEVAFEKLREIQAPVTALSARPYLELIDKQLRPFLKQYSNSSRVADVRDILQSLEVDLSRFKRGEVKVAGMWYDAKTRAEEKYQIEGALVLDTMRREIAAGNLPDAMNAFEMLQRAYPNSVAYAEADPLARQTLKAIGKHITFALAHLQETRTARQAAIDRTPPQERQSIVAAVARDDALAAACAATAQRNNEHFYSIFPWDEKGLRGMQQAVEQLSAGLATEPENLADRVSLIHQIGMELSRHEITG